MGTVGVEMLHDASQLFFVPVHSYEAENAIIICVYPSSCWAVGHISQLATYAITRESPLARAGGPPTTGLRVGYDVTGFLVVGTFVGFYWNKRKMDIRKVLASIHDANNTTLLECKTHLCRRNCW